MIPCKLASSMANKIHQNLHIKSTWLRSFHDSLTVIIGSFLRTSLLVKTFLSNVDKGKLPYGSHLLNEKQQFRHYHLSRKGSNIVYIVLIKQHNIKQLRVLNIAALFST